jgi:hypothetical protein
MTCGVLTASEQRLVVQIWTYSTVAAMSGKKLSNLASIDVGVQLAISHFV